MGKPTEVFAPRPARLRMLFLGLLLIAQSAPATILVAGSEGGLDVSASLFGTSSDTKHAPFTLGLTASYSDQKSASTPSTINGQAFSSASLNFNADVLSGQIDVRTVSTASASCSKTCNALANASADVKFILSETYAYDIVLNQPVSGSLHLFKSNDGLSFESYTVMYERTADASQEVGSPDGSLGPGLYLFGAASDKLALNIGPTFASGISDASLSLLHPVPLPSTLVMLTSAIACAGLFGKRSKRPT